MKAKKYINLLFLSIISGLVCGIIGSVFAFSISFVTSLRSSNGLLIYFLPFGGLLSVFIYKKLKLIGVGTDSVFESITDSKSLSYLLAPAVFICSVITHLFGGSAGREGAALQLGGGVSTFLSKIFKLENDYKKTLSLCSMAAFFSAIFGTPFGAFIFVIEVIFSKSLCLFALIPTLLGSLSAYFVAKFIGVKPERFNLSDLPEINFSIIWKICVISLCCALVSILFCYSLKYSKKLFKRIFVNEYVRIFVGGTLIVLITLLIGTRDYNGAGVDIIEHIFEHGTVKYEAFILKIILTSLTVAAGYKGGEIIPSLFIGATLGASFAILLGIPSALGAAVGMTALFCGVTNCPFAATIISIEMFGIKGIIFIILSAIISYVFSAKITLYDIKTNKLLK